MEYRDKKSILFVIDSLTCGGAEKSLVSLLSLLDYTQMEVDLMMVTRGGMFEQYVPQEVQVLSFPKAKGFRRFWYFVCQLYFSFLLRLYRILKKKKHGAEVRWGAMKSGYAPLREHYDVAVAYQQGFPTYYVAEKVNADRKYAWINVDLSKAGYDERFNRRYYDMMTRIVPVSDVLCQMLGKTGYVDEAKLYTVYDILNVDLMRRMAQENDVWDDIHTEGFSLVTAGRMAPQKNYILAVETAKVLKDMGLMFRWYFVGDGSERLSVENLIAQYCLQDCISLVGMQPNPYPYMANCDIYVQTSSFEGFCLTLREARIFHKPVVSTNFPVVYDQIKDGENGLIAEMTAESLAEKIMLLVNNPDLRERLIENTRKETDLTAMTESKKVNELLLA